MFWDGDAWSVHASAVAVTVLPPATHPPQPRPC